MAPKSAVPHQSVGRLKGRPLIGQAREALIKSVFAFILEILCNARSKEWDDANSELFKESHDEAVHKISYESKLYELISASLAASFARLAYSKRNTHTAYYITSSEPARKARPFPGRTHRSARSARTIEPGRRRRLNPPAFRNTVQQAAVSGQPHRLTLSQGPVS